MTKSEQAGMRRHIMRQLRASGAKLADIGEIMGIGESQVSALTKDVHCPVNHRLEALRRAHAARDKVMTSRIALAKKRARGLHSRGRSIDEIAKLMRRRPSQIEAWVVPGAADRLDARLKLAGIRKAERAPIVEATRRAA